MTIRETRVPGVLVIEPRVFQDDRGRFMETYRRERYCEIGLPPMTEQDNVSVSKRGVLRGLHFQWPLPQAKLVSCLHGEVWDVAVDIREGSPSFGQWHAERLTAENALQLFIPEGFAHGFCVLGNEAVLSYKCSSGYVAEYDAAVAWNDPTLNLPWPIEGPPVLSAKDAAAPFLANLVPDRQPRFEPVSPERASRI